MKSKVLFFLTNALFLITLSTLISCAKEAEEIEPERTDIVEIGSVKDSLGNNYKTVEIIDLSRTWLAENLNIDLGADSSWCYDDSLEYCNIYGRMYTLESAEVGCKSLGTGWRVPTIDDWVELAHYYGGYSNLLTLNPFQPYHSETYSKLIDGGSSQFDVLLGGYHDMIIEKYVRLGDLTKFWSTSPAPVGNIIFEFKAPGGSHPSDVGISSLAGADRIYCRCVKQ